MHKDNNCHYAFLIKPVNGNYYLNVHTNVYYSASIKFRL